MPACQWEHVAERFGDSPGARCSRGPAAGGRFCPEHLQRLAEHAVKEARPTDRRFFRKYAQHFASVFIGAVATAGAKAVIDNWDTIIAALGSLASQVTGGGWEGLVSVSFTWGDEIFEVSATTGWEPVDRHVSVLLSQTEADELGVELDVSGWELVNRFVRRMVCAPTQPAAPA